jgi:two-component system KDP operon response regulator KdpE
VTPPSARILVVEDDRALGQSLLTALTDAGWTATRVPDGSAALEAVKTADFDVMLLDIGLPVIDGWTVLRSFEGRRSPSVIIISARGDERDKVRALDMGADDYLAKPFGADELLARVRAVLRRAKPEPEPQRIVRWGGVTVDLGRRAVFRDGGEVKLSPTEYLLLAELARHAHEVMGYRRLLQRVWGAEYADERQYLRTFIQRLRIKLEEDPRQPVVITTVLGRGYRFGPAQEALTRA